MRNDFTKRIKIEKREDRELTTEELSALQKMATPETYKGAKCINVPELYLQQEDYERIYDKMIRPVIETNSENNSQKKGGESR